jgi:type I restriction enzyme S subunit
MREDWRKVDLGGLIETKKGFAFKSGWYTSFGVPIVRVSDFTDNSISINEINYISNDLAQEHIKHQLHFRDILIQTVGSWQSNPASIVGKVVTVPIELNGALLNQNAVKIIPKSGIDKRFLYYRLKEENFKFHNLNHAQGAANQASITLESIKKFKFKLPTLHTQRKIAAVLSAYDDLIENNLKRIKLLEEKPQLTYEEWFVKMRFPGYETDKFDEVTGLPEGWGKVKLGEVAEFKYGKMPKPENLTKSGFPVYSGYRITSYTNDYLFEKPTLIVVARGVGGTGDVKITPEKCWLTNLSIAILVKDSIYQNYLYYLLKDANLRSLDSGAAQSQITISNLENFIVIKSEIQLQKIFNTFIDKIFNQINILKNQNRLLKEARDILLPRLMSGMIDVDEVQMETLQTAE